MASSPERRRGDPLKKKRLAEGIVLLCLLLCIPLYFFIAKGFLQHQTEPAEGNRRELSEGVRNIVKRSHQMTDIRWTPQKDVLSWAGTLVYHAGTEYTGLPYGQAVDGCYVPSELDLNGFLAVVADPDSKMYTARSSHNSDAPYYACDCCSFVCWAWGESKVRTTASIARHATAIGDDLADAEVGDCLCRVGRHVVLITDIVSDDDGAIIAVELSEATTAKRTDYCCLRTWYGSGYTNSLQDLQRSYLDQNYRIYRWPDRDQMPYAHSGASPLEGDVCELCGFGTDP